MLQLVWLKRDLRIRDHRPLAEAAARGPVLCLYVYEPELLRSDEFDPSHLVFINECLAELDRELQLRGGSLVTRVGRIPKVFEEFRAKPGIAHLWSHRETGNRLTYDRDLRVKDWAERHNIPWTEIPQDGVIRRLKTRDGWARRWTQRMNEPIGEPPARIQAAEADPGGLRSLEELGLPPNSKPGAQVGGESVARETLESFLGGRGVNYRQAMSSPVEGWDGCSRLSPHLAWGAISIRQVHQRLQERRDELKADKKTGVDIPKTWLGSLSSFAGRLRWHCHFMQKLEDEPDLEFENMHRAYDGLRENEFDPALFEAWKQGETGYPMVDACMRCLHETGWINFRMRAMLVSFASYHLWLHWRPTSLWLAQHFLDFEPGIHFSQFQMQSGTTGINTVRIYSPAKQVRDQDPTGVFLRRWLPELADVPDEYLPEPHTMPPLVQQAAGCVIGKDYPAPVVDHATAYEQARDRVYAVRRGQDSRDEAQRVYQKHGSRRRPSVRGRT